MKYYLLLMACFILMQGLAQNGEKKYYAKEFSFTTDNDAYMLRLKDGYYTSGLFFQYSLASEKNKQKTIQRFELGQTMFTTGDRRAVLRGEQPIDRPYCGYLYIKYSKDKFVLKDGLLNWNVSLAVTGKWSLAQQLQESYHKLIHLNYYPYWQTQIPNSVGLNGGIGYKKTVAASSVAKIVSVTEANAGMFYINAKAGAYFCLGLFEKNEQGALFNASIASKETGTKRAHELFAYFYPQVIVQGYNATLQGALLYKTGNAITAKPETFMYQQTFGIAYAKARWTTRLEATYQTKETAMQIRQQRYGSVQFAYRFN